MAGGIGLGAAAGVGALTYYYPGWAFGVASIALTGGLIARGRNTCYHGLISYIMSVMVIGIICLMIYLGKETDTGGGWYITLLVFGALWAFNGAYEMHLARDIGTDKRTGQFTNCNDYKQVWRQF
jgi:hypothetical protein